ncbi:transcriptional regulator, IclR family [Deinococcus reticulitermitis]|uniref:Transcriptional regulator, IclR family n=1 Tax=Deinococcus reticulitermitis TaxID=856736 RepID=A0A1H6ZKQ1_9DEIO|nr:IclR family transcriptional regulator [Deinococcus reticulitermitis]SEJ50160.1 transcriptional regulator, IclR family [Deinococcus reticulitermitis]
MTDLAPEQKTARQKTGRTRSGDAGSVRTLERGLSVLSALAELRQASLTQIAKRAGLSASTAYRLLETLRQQGYVEWEERTGLFSVGLRAYQVGAAFSERNALLGAAQGEMRSLVDDLNETANLAVLRGPEAVYVHQVEARQMMRMFTQIGAAAPLHCSGVGKVLAAWLPEAEVRARLGEGPFPAYTPNSITTLPAYLKELREVRAQGYALDDEERELGVRCLATPVHDAARAVVGSLSISAPTSRFPREQVPAMLERVQDASRQISLRLGWTP